MNEHFPEPIHLGGRVKIKIDLSIYETKADLENATGVVTSKFIKKVDLASIKSETDKLDIDKLKNVPSNLNNLKSKVDKLDFGKLETAVVDLSKLSDVIKLMLLKNVYIAMIKDIQDEWPNITNLATNTTVNAKMNEVKNEIPSITSLATTAALNAEISEVKYKISKISNLAATATLTALENNIPNVSNLVKKLTIIQKSIKLKRTLLIIIGINILQHKN